jgi:hypothetical protein
VTEVSFRRALGLGASAAFSRAAPALLLGLAVLAGTCCITLLWLNGLGSLVHGGAKARLLALLLGAVLAWVLQAALLGGAVRQATSTLLGRPVPSLTEAMASSMPRALSWAVLAGAALLGWMGWEFLVGASSLLLFLRGLLHAGGGLAGALGLALLASLGPLGALFLQLSLEMALVRSVVREEPASVALWESSRTLLARPWAPFGLLVLTAFVAATLVGTAAALAGMGPPLTLRFARGTALLQLCIAGLASAMALLVRLDAFAALELGRTAELPPAPMPIGPAAPRAELVLDGTPVLEARAVEPSSGAGG